MVAAACITAVIASLAIVNTVHVVRPAVPPETTSPPVTENPEPELAPAPIASTTTPTLAAPATTTSPAPAPEQPQVATPPAEETAPPPASEPQPAQTVQPPKPEPEPETNYSTTGFGGVKPFVAVIGHLLQSTFKVDVIGVAARNRTSDHPLGYALDFLVGTDRAKGDKIAACVLAHEDLWHVSYVIWRQRINYGDGWEAMADRGSITENHYDHVHVSFDHGALAVPLVLTC